MYPITPSTKPIPPTLHLPGGIAATAWSLAASGTESTLASTPGAQDGEIDLCGRTILVCEDEPLIAYDIASGVEEAGGDVVGPFAAVAEALAALDRAVPDGAVLDVNLLDGDVTPVLLRLVAANVPVVVNTGTKLPDEAAELGVPVFIKPTEPERLVEAIACR